MDKEIKDSEITNLSRLLLNEETTNVAVALEFLKHNKEYIPYVRKELALFAFWGDAAALQAEASGLLRESSAKEDFENIRKAFEIIPRLDYLKEINDYAAACIEAHQKLMEDYLPLVLKNSKYVDLYYDAGFRLYYQLKTCTDFALSCFEVCLRAAPENAEVLFNLGHIYRKRDVQKSVEYYLRCVAADPENAGAYYNLASIFNKTDIDKADYYYDLALQTKPDVYFFRVNVAGVKMHRKRFAEAEPIVMRLYDDYPEDDRVLDLYCSLLWEYRKDYAAAEKAYENALELYPDDENLRGNYGEMLMEMNRNEEALECFHRVLSEDSSLHRFSTLIVCLVLKLNRPEEALVHYSALKEKYADWQKPETLNEGQWNDFLEAITRLQGA